MIKTFMDTTIDAIQSTKKIAIDALVKHEVLAKSLNDFVDTQTEYTRKAVDASLEAGTNVYNVITDKAFYTETLKTMQETAKSFYTQRKGN